MNTTYTELRAHLAKRMDEVCDNRETLVVTRQGGRSVVMMAQDEYDSIMETLHLLRSSANAAILTQAIADANAGKMTEFDPREDPLD